MVDWSAMLNRKYDILQQQADADTTRANAGMLSAQAGAGVARSAAAENFAQADLFSTTAKNNRGGPTSGALVDIPSAGSAIEAGKTFSLDDSDAAEKRRGMGMGRLGFAKGTARVPGKGSPKVDKVPAMLAPGEAVLNAPAAKMMGRGLIAKANAAGRKKMGMA